MYGVIVYAKAACTERMGTRLSCASHQTQNLSSLHMRALMSAGQACIQPCRPPSQLSSCLGHEHLRHPQGLQPSLVMVGVADALAACPSCTVSGMLPKFRILLVEPGAAHNNIDMALGPLSTEPSAPPRQACLVRRFQVLPCRPWPHGP